MKPWHLFRAAAVVAGGGILAYPTEAVYGLGCSPFRAEAVLRILRLKRRDPGKGLILIGSNIRQFHGLVDLDRLERREQILASWPGHVTWILPARPGAPRWLRGDSRTLAVRVSAHPDVRRLCDRTGALVSTSANPAGAPPARTGAGVRAYFGPGVDFIIPGRAGPAARPSEIRDAVSGRILRSGG